MPDLIYRFDLSDRPHQAGPADCAAAVARLEQGNKHFAAILSADHTADAPQIIHYDGHALGLPSADGSPPTQRPFAAVLSCADARVPVEMILGQACNDIFVVRVAGNVLGSECLGSLDYAITNMADSLRVLLVMGHTNCGAVAAAVEAFIEPTRYLQFASSHPLRAIVDRLFVSVRAAHQALETVYGQQVEAHKGYRVALAHVSVVLNAAMQAATVQREFHTQVGAKFNVVYGVYDLATRRVKVPLETVDPVSMKFTPPPADDVAFTTLGTLIAGSARVRKLLA